MNRNNVFKILKKEYSKDYNLRNIEVLKECFSYFDNTSWLNLTNEEQEILIHPILKNEVDYNRKLYENLFVNSRYIDKNFYNNRYIWDGCIWKNNNLQELRESILENDNDCVIYSLINKSKFFIVKHAFPPNTNEVINFFKKHSNISTLNCILSYYEYLELNLKEKRQIKSIIISNDLQTIEDKLNVIQLKNNYSNIMKS